MTLNGLLEESRRKIEKGGCFWTLSGERPTDCEASMFGFIISASIAKR